MRAPLFALAYLTAFITEPKRREERGAAITEYVVLIAFIVAAAAVLVGTGVWDNVAEKISDMVDSVGGTPSTTTQN